MVETKSFLVFPNKDQKFLAYAEKSNIMRANARALVFGAKNVLWNENSVANMFSYEVFSPKHIVLTKHV